MSESGTILGLDPGTRFGWALRHDAQRMDSGVWDLAPRRFEGAGMRWVRLRGLLRQVLDPKPALVAIEEVRRHLGTDAAHLYGGALAVVQAECEAAGVPYLGIPVGTIKKHATGKGSANKADMMGAASLKWGRPFRDDNEADARWIAEAAAHELGRALTVGSRP